MTFSALCIENQPKTHLKIFSFARKEEPAKLQRGASLFAKKGRIKKKSRIFQHVNRKMT